MAVSSPPLICLATPGHNASAPRLRMEADAPVEAGYRMHWVAGVAQGRFGWGKAFGQFLAGIDVLLHFRSR